MGDVLTGSNAVWEFEPDTLVIRYTRGVRASRLLQALGERRIPHTALAGATLGRGRRGAVVLRAVPRPGADPLMEAAAGQLKESADPYRLVLPEQSRTLAEYYRDELLAATGHPVGSAGGAGPAGAGSPDGRAGGSPLGPADVGGEIGPGEPVGRFLVAAPSVPRSFKAYDAKAFFDGRTVSFRWFWTGASTAKWRAGDQTFAVDELRGVDWRSPELMHGYLRLLRREDRLPPERSGAADPPGPPQADQDPAAVLFGLGYGPVHESLPFAAAVLAATASH